MKRFVEHIGIDRLPEEAIVIGDDLSLFCIKGATSTIDFEEPHKLSHAIIVICTSGSCSVRVNLVEYHVESPRLLNLMPGQIVEALSCSDDFVGYAIALSKRFIDMINLPGWQHQYIDMYNNPITYIDSDRLMAVRIFYAMLYRAAANDKNPFRLQVIENLIRVFYYGGISSFENKEPSQNKYKNSVVAKFLELVQTHYREQRLISFYAGELCITPKYLSKLVKEHTGRSAGEWIESHVILEARAMLQSSDMTIQQIATYLHFPNQSFFGKYFKRATGISPKSYRANK
ncbi:MAG: AraC family transcriptional regulator [Alistipes sp.]|nr:AraC family transcriptional regulator [Alistipes sp.]